MRVFTSLNVAIAISLLATPATFSQINPSNLTITGYQLISEQRVTRTQSYFTYAADVINTGPSLPAITATVTSLVPSAAVVAGKGNLHFAAVPSRTQVSSTNTFTLLIDRTASFSFNSVRWSFSAPVASAGDDQTVGLGSTVRLDGSKSTNPSGLGTLTYAWSFQSVPPGSLAALQNANSVAPSFVADKLGDYIISVNVSNGSGTDSASVKVSTTNSLPVADAGPNQTVTVGATVHLDGSRSHDVDGDPLTYAWTLLQVPAGSQAVLAGPTSVMPTFVADKVGTYLAQLVVNDGTTNSPPATVTITTTPGHTPPVANAGPNQTANVSALVQLDGSGSTDVDGNPLTYKWSLITLPAGSAATLSSTTAVKPTFTADVAGTYIAQLIVNDGFNDSTPATVTISTSAVQPPVANAGPNQTTGHGATVTLSGSGSDPQNLPLTFKWALTSKPAGSSAVLSSTTIAGPTFVADLPGTYIAQLIVNNGTLNSAPATVTITTTNTAPVANAGPAQSVSVGSTVTLDASGSSDADHDPLTYRWSLLNIPVGSSAQLLSANTTSPTFVADKEGSYVAQLIVNDGFVDSAPSTVTITATLGASITLSPDPLNLFNAAGTLTVSIGVPARAGGQPITLTVFDANVATVPQTVTIPETTTSTTVTVTPGTIGGTTILASAPGFRPGSATINVSAPAILLSLSSNSVGISKSITGTVTLSAPAPTNLSVSLSADRNGVVTIPGSVTVTSGTNTGTFTITGASAGSTNITAAAAGYSSDSRSVSVFSLGAITLQSGVVVGVGQSTQINVSLVTPAPTGGVTIALSSDDPRVTVTSSVFIRQGATTPDTPAQVTGVNIGTANITASASGFASDTKSVQVAANLSFNPQAVTLSLNGSQTLTLTLSGNAPQGGLAVTLSSDNTNAATVPPNVTIPQNTNSTTVQVSAGGTTGTANITASSSVPGIIAGVAKVTVVQGVAISATLTPGVVGTAYNATVTATGGTAPYTFSATGLPAGLSISAAGVISGTPQSAGTSTPTITVTDSSGPPHLTATATPTLVINGALSISTTSLPSGVVGSTYNATVAATGGNGPYTFSATGLPAGLSISASGQITGTPQTAGNPTAVITVTDSTSPTHLTATANLSIAVSAAVSITTTALSNGAVGVPYTFTVNATGGTTPYTFAATGLPAGLSISSAGVISGTPQGAGTSTVNITVTDSTAPTHGTATASLSLVINSALAITTSSLNAGVVGLPYTATITASGGQTPYTFSATGLPAGLSISSAGQITGTPQAAGTATVNVTVTDSSSPAHMTANSSLVLNINPALTITTTSLSNGAVNVPYAATVAASGGATPYTFTATGLPPGLSMSTAGQITGTPQNAAASTVNVTVTDSTNPTHATASASLSITINAAVAITTSSLPAGIAGVPYTATLNAAGGTAPYTFTATGLPAGLSISAGGVISGTPQSAGSSTVSITATDSSPAHTTASASLQLTVNPGLAVTTSSPLPAGTVNLAYSASVTASGGTAPYSFSATGLPAGLSISAAGVISGTPQVPGTSMVNISVTDSTSPTHATASASLSITINPGLAIATTSLPGGTVNLAYSASVTATGGAAPYTFTATGLPAGLSISTNGAISGSPQTAGTSTVNITVTDSTSPTHATASASLNLTVMPALAITTASLPNGTVGSPYSATVAATGGTSPYTFSATGLPAGLSISAAGVISGNPQTAGTSTVALKVTDSTNPTHLMATANLNVTIAAPPLSITTTSLPVGVTQVSYFANLTAAGGTLPYHWALTSGSLPLGLSLDPSTGTISGTPTQSAINTPLTFTVTDTGSPAQTATVTLSLTINQGGAGPSVTITGATVGQNLQTPVVVTLSAPASSALNVTITSSNPGLVVLGARAGDTGTGTLTIQLGAGSTSFSVNVQGLGSSGSATLSVTASGYASGSSQVNLAPSAFVLSGPNGIGGSFTSNQGVGTPLTVSAALLDSTGHVAVIQPLAGGMTANVNLSIANPALGSVTPTTAAFTGGIDTVPVQFTAGTSAVSSTITAAEPAGFGTPAGNANVLPVTVQPAAIIPGNVTVGQNLETTTTISLQGATPADLNVTVTSNDPSKLLLSTDPLAAGVPSITLLIKAGFSSTAPFFVYGLGNTGSVTYSASAPGFGSANGTVTLARTGFVLSGPFGQGQDFLTTTGSAPSFLDVTTAVLDASGNPLASQNLAGGVSVAVNVTSANTTVGTITTSPVTIAAGNNTATTQFQPLASGSTLLSVAGPAPYVVPSTAASLMASVSSPKILISGDSVGNNLQQVATIFLGAAAPANGLPVTLTVTSGAASLSATGTGAGSASITVTIPAGGFSGNFMIYGGDSSGTASITAAAPGYISGSTSVNLVPSGVVIAGPSGLGFKLQTTVGAGNQPVSVSTVKIDPTAGIQVQPLKGGAALPVALGNSDPTIGTIPASASIPGGSDTGIVQFTPVKAGTTFLSVTQPAGFATPVQFTMVEADVQ